MLTLMLLARDVHAYAAGTNPAEYNQPCDSITVCSAGDDGLTCPEGMQEVASPTRSDVYHIRGGEGEGAVADDPRGAPWVERLCGAPLLLSLTHLKAALSPSPAKLLEAAASPAFSYFRALPPLVHFPPAPLHLLSHPFTPAHFPEYVPGQTVTITISVMTKNIRRIQHAGRPSCYCEGDINFVDYGDCGSYACYGGTDMCGGKGGKEKKFEGLPCNTPRYESARYLGLLLYAVDAGEQRVGSWELSTALPVVFWLPPDLACEGKSVMHANARPKALVEHLTFRAPSIGVGPITFRALIKQGATEGGAFYWPVAPAQGALTMHTVPTAGTGAASGDLTLTESTGTTPMQVRENAIVRLWLLLPVLMNSLYSLSLSLPPPFLSLPSPLAHPRCGSRPLKMGRIATTFARQTAWSATPMSLKRWLYVYRIVSTYYQSPCAVPRLVCCC